MAACNVVFRSVNENTSILDQNEFLYLSYQAFTPQHLICKQRLVDLKFTLDFRNLSFHQIMIPCPGSHNPVQTNLELDTFVDEIYISYGFEINQAIIYKKVRAINPEDDFYFLQDNIRISWNNLIPVMSRNHVTPNRFELSYIEKSYEVQVIYVREKNYTYV